MSDFTDFIGGGGATIDSAMPLNWNKDVAKPYNSGTWLKSGVVETDLTIYPNAKVEDIVGIYMGVLYAKDQESYIKSLEISADGSKAYVVGASTDRVFQYDLSVPFDVSSGVYSSKSMVISGEEITVESMTMTNDGTKVFIVGTDQDTIFQYTLSVPFDISTGAYAGKSFSILSQESIVSGISISADGTTMFLSGLGGYPTTGTIFQYTLSVPFDISSASYLGKSLDVTSEGVYPVGIAISADGTALYTVDSQNCDTVFKYDLATSLDISTGVYSGNSLVVSAKDAAPNDLALSADGNNLYVVGSITGKITHYSIAPHVGRSFASTDKDTGLPIYIKVA